MRHDKSNERDWLSSGFVISMSFEICVAARFDRLMAPPSPVGSANDVAVTSPDVTRCRRDVARTGAIAKDRDNVTRMSRDVARMSRCRGVSRKIVRVPV